MAGFVRFRAGSLWGVSVMKFTLTYDGPLRSSGNKPKPKDKWDIRKKIHPQLVDLWSSHPALKFVEENRHFPLGTGVFLRVRHHTDPGPIPQIENLPQPTAILDLCEDIDVHGCLFRPLVRESHALHCGLKILFLRKEAPGRVYQGGDIDGRIKTLMDALAMPQHETQIFADDAEVPRPLYCLMQDDSMVSSLDVQSERLLTDENHDADYVRLVIEVDVRVRQATIYNQSFLG